MLGLKRGTVALYPHEKAWAREAQNTILRLKAILGDTAADMQHVGSTAVPGIKAKPIIDIAVATDDFNNVLALTDELQAGGFYYRPKTELGGQLLFACGSYYDGTGDEQTHFIHVVRSGSKEWTDYINFRDYLIATPAAAKEYEALKVFLAQQTPTAREIYTRKKHDFITRTLQKAAQTKI